MGSAATATLHNREADVSPGIEQRMTTMLGTANAGGGFPLSMVCTTEGLPIASSGEGSPEDLAGFTSLFEDIVARASRDLGLKGIGELTLRNADGRHVIRPLRIEDRTVAFLVVRVPRQRSWRRLTNRLVVELTEALAPLLAQTWEEARAS